MVHAALKMFWFQSINLCYGAFNVELSPIFLMKFLLYPEGVTVLQLMWESLCIVLLFLYMLGFISKMFHLFLSQMKLNQIFYLWFWPSNLLHPGLYSKISQNIQRFPFMATIILYFSHKWRIILFCNEILLTFFPLCLCFTLGFFFTEFACMWLLEKLKWF